jgi:hypothetical protein
MNIIELRGLCNQCHNRHTPAVVEAWWEELKHRIKEKDCICDVLSDYREWKFAKFEAKCMGNSDRKQNKTHKPAMPEKDDICANLGSDEPINHTPSIFWQPRLPEICSFCRRCREIGNCDLAWLSQSGDDTTSMYSVCGSNYSKKHQISGNDNLLRDLEFEMPTGEFIVSNPMLYAAALRDLTVSRATVLSNFRAQGGRWKNRYLPGELYCFKCLAALEGWNHEQSGDEPTFEMEEEVTYSIPGAFVG